MHPLLAHFQDSIRTSTPAVIAVHRDLDGLATLALILRMLPSKAERFLSLRFLDEFEAFNGEDYFDLAIDLPIDPQRASFTIDHHKETAELALGYPQATDALLVDTMVPPPLLIATALNVADPIGIQLASVHYDGDNVFPSRLGRLDDIVRHLGGAKQWDQLRQVVAGLARRGVAYSESSKFLVPFRSVLDEMEVSWQGLRAIIACLDGVSDVEVVDLTDVAIGNFREFVTLALEKSPHCVLVLAYSDPHGNLKISLRTVLVNVDLGAIARVLGGGGQKGVAGFVIPNGAFGDRRFTEALSTIIALLQTVFGRHVSVNIVSRSHE